MGKSKKIKKPKPECCGKFRKKDKHCRRCPVIFREQCKLDTKRSEMIKKKKKEDKEKAKKKAEKALSTKKVDKKKDKKMSQKKDKKKKR